MRYEVNAVDLLVVLSPAFSVSKDSNFSLFWIILALMVNSVKVPKCA